MAIVDGVDPRLGRRQVDRHPIISKLVPVLHKLVINWRPNMSTARVMDMLIAKFTANTSLRTVTMAGASPDRLEAIPAPCINIGLRGTGHSSLWGWKTERSICGALLFNHKLRVLTVVDSGTGATRSRERRCRPPMFRFQWALVASGTTVLSMAGRLLSQIVASLWLEALPQRGFTRRITGLLAEIPRSWTGVAAVYEVSAWLRASVRWKPWAFARRRFSWSLVKRTHVVLGSYGLLRPVTRVSLESRVAQDAVAPGP
eukprot:scaffold207_cov409-Prasinococcus_capsulatus_cf.AAC.25